MPDREQGTWEDVFRSRAERMEQLGQTVNIDATEEGLIAFQTERPCRECGNHGVYSGIAVFYDKLFKSVNADFCPACKHVGIVSESNPLIASGPERFLPLMIKRLQAYPELLSETKTGKDPCPKCQAETHQFEVGKGVINGFGHRWTACLAGCGWDGLYEPIV